MENADSSKLGISVGLMVGTTLEDGRAVIVGETLLAGINVGIVVAVGVDSGVVVGSVTDWPQEINSTDKTRQKITFE